ncbi:Hypothetical Protein FCC1311_007302 [Hondaea fermentalgiana]|uniref:Uncharacterized protein n=1 Tax=Hondaea fermentalgiana TaxID=2315210 RepID=A0A2R5G8X6_9STRA|nr:Hypothetical Protein FCC1311_007302 [Hondaea fermentalgiana]|eukprot:GBG24511.1 Hypothetical Protein FCC1311_007302 [Hondaea fermentalgiana]
MWDLQNRCETLTRKRQELSLFVSKKLPKESKMLQREEEQKNALVAEAEARVASLEAEFAELERQERRGENLTALAIQAWYRGARHCFQPYEDPVWIVTDLETASYCRTCAKAVGEESRARTNKECTLVRNSLVATLQERLDAKEVAFRVAGEALERQRRELMIHEGFESLIRKELPAEHLFERLVLAGILEDED